MSNACCDLSAETLAVAKPKVSYCCDLSAETLAVAKSKIS